MPGIHEDAVLLMCHEPARDGRVVVPSLHGAFEDPIVPTDVLPPASIGLRTNPLHSVVACVD